LKVYPDRRMRAVWLS